jgi:electron transfer flavoprotein alpha subunit
MKNRNIDTSDIWILVERRDDFVHPVSFELLTKGRELINDLGGELVAVIFGKSDEGVLRLVERYGAQKIFEIEIEQGLAVSPEAMAEAFCMAVSELHPSVVLSGATAFGRTLMPLIAVRLGTGLTADCTELAIDPERKLLLQTRPAFGGNILATIECPESKPQMATVRPHVFRMKKVPSPPRAVHTQKMYRPVLRRVTELVESIVEQEKMDIAEADIIVSGGRGLGKPEGFELLSRLAEKLGGMTGASRGAVDLGWYSSAFQVGQTGHTVSPKLYIACGISGAVQHVVGMKSAGTIIAINEDPDAPIFQVSDYGIVGDLYEVVPALLEEIGDVEKH